MTPEEIARVQRIEGQIAAIGMILNALVKESADPQALLAALTLRAEKMQAGLLASQQPDPLREGADDFFYQWISKRPK